MFARLSRIVPMLIVLAVVAAIVYIVAAWRYSPNRAKELLIRIFTAITGAVSAFFLLVCAYAWLERNGAVFDLSFSFLLTALIGLGIRTPDTLLGCTRLAGEHLRPLGQLSAV